MPRESAANSTDLQEVDKLLEQVGRVKVAQRALEQLPQLTLSALARKDLRAALTCIQTAQYGAHAKPMSFAEMVKFGQAHIEARVTKRKLRELMLEVVAELSGTRASNLAMG